MPNTKGSQTYQNWTPSLGETDEKSVLKTLGQLEQLMPFLVGLTREERRRLPKVGPRTRPFIADTIATAEANPGIVPRSVNLTTLRSRADTLDRLGEVKRTLTQLLERVEDTEIRLASDVYATARSVYSVMKTPATVPGLNEQKALLGRRFAKKGKRRPNEETTAVKASG
jgi:hypothetical protein